MSAAVIKLAEVFSWMKIPFTFGEAHIRRSSEGEEKEGRRRSLSGESDGTVRTTSYNGQVSAIQLFIVLIVISGTRLLSFCACDSTDGTQTRVILVVYMIIGLMVIAGLYKKRQNFLFVAPSSTGSSVERDRDDVSVAGIVTFFVLGTLHDFMHILASFSCRNAWYSCHNGYFLTKDMVHITYHVVRIVYLACQTILCMVFNHAYFLDRSLARHGLMVLQAVNISLWLYEVVLELINDVYSGAHSVPKKADHFALECHSNLSNSSFDLAACLSSNNTLLYYTQTYGNPILRPFNIEYSLLVCKCLARWFITCRAKSTDPHSTTRRRLLGSSIGRGTETEAEVSEIHLSETAEVERDVEQLADKPHPPEEVQRLTSEVPAASRSLTVILLLISIIINLLLVLFVFVPRIPEAPRGLSIHFKSMREIAAYYSCFYYLTMIVVIAVGYHITRRFRVLKDMPFGGLDYLLLFTSSGNLAFDLIRLMGVLKSSETNAFTSSTTKAFYAGYVFLEVIQTSFQVSFSLYAGRLRTDNEGNSLKPILFRAFILYLALCNLTTWVIQTFAGSVTSQPLVTNYFGMNGWPIMKNVLLPMYLFFRFNSFLLFIRIYRRCGRWSP